MAPSPPRLRILSVGGNAVSAFLSWRLQATNACDVTLVWKSGFETVSQYGISFKSNKFGNERFKPLHVVRAPEDAAGRKAAFDYVLLCVKALPDVYDLAAVIESVVTPQHTCILVNTTHTLGVESHLEERFPTNVVLSLVSGAELNQLGPSEFEHTGATNIWVGPANNHSDIPPQIQNDMAEALAMTLSTGQVDCTVTPNICQQQFDRMIGPIAFHPLSVLMETPSHIELIEKTGARPLIADVIEELINIAQAKDCEFPPDFKDTTIEEMTRPTEHNSTMYQDFLARRPMEVETYLGAPIKLGEEAGLSVPRIASLYTLMHNLNITNQNRPPPSVSPAGSTNGAPAAANAAPLPPRTSSVGPRPGGPPNGAPNGMGRGRAASMGPPPPARRGGPAMNGHPRQSNGYPPRNSGQLQRQGSFENNDLEEFSHLAFIDDIPEGDVAPGYGGGGGGAELALRERELMLRQKELQLREQEINMRARGGGGRRGPPRRGGPGGPPGFEDDDDDDEFVDPMNPRTSVPMIDPDNFDMMSVTSRRYRKAPTTARDFRKNPEMGSRMSGAYRGGRNRTSAAQLMSDVPAPGEHLMDNPMAYGSGRYGGVDRSRMQDDPRAGSLTRERLEQLQNNSGLPGMNGAYPQPPPGPGPRRTSLSPGDGLNPGPGRRVSGRPSPPGNGYMSPNGPPINGRPSPPGMRQPIPRHPPGQGNAVAPHQFEQHAGVSKNLHKRPAHNVRSLTGSASASGESAHLDSENSAHSSQASFALRPTAGMR